jgi:hypothetical protein
VVLLLICTYIYLFSAWQFVLSQPWIQLVFALGITQMILLLIAPQREQRLGWGEVALIVGLFLYPRVIQEMRALFANALVYRAATGAGLLLLLGLVFVLYTPHGEKFRSGFIAWREKYAPTDSGSFRSYVSHRSFIVTLSSRKRTFFMTTFVS